MATQTITFPIPVERMNLDMWPAIISLLETEITELMAVSDGSERYTAEITRRVRLRSLIAQEVQPGLPADLVSPADLFPIEFRIILGLDHRDIVNVSSIARRAEASADYQPVTVDAEATVGVSRQLVAGPRLTLICSMFNSLRSEHQGNRVKEDVTNG
jgi:hypothetical protein